MTGTHTQIIYGVRFKCDHQTVWRRPELTDSFMFQIFVHCVVCPVGGILTLGFLGVPQAFQHMCWVCDSSDIGKQGASPSVRTAPEEEKVEILVEM